jgi:hypothetical protein
MKDLQPPITPLPQTPPQATAQRYVYVATIQWYPVARHLAETPPSQSTFIARMWSPHTPPPTGQDHCPPKALYAQPSDIPPHSAPHYLACKARDREPRVAEALLGCAILLVIGILMLMFLYYLSAAR